MLRLGTEAKIWIVCRSPRNGLGNRVCVYVSAKKTSVGMSVYLCVKEFRRETSASVCVCVYV